MTKPPGCITCDCSPCANSEVPPPKGASDVESDDAHIPWNQVELSPEISEVSGGSDMLFQEGRTCFCEPGQEMSLSVLLSRMRAGECSCVEHGLGWVDCPTRSKGVIPQAFLAMCSDEARCG